MTWLAFVPLAIWIYMLAGHGQFWRLRERDEQGEADCKRTTWPSVVAVVPARDEALVIEETISSLLHQDYPGAFRIVLVDDQSTDQTAEKALSLGASGRLEIVTGRPRPQGWTGKLWAMRQGFERACADHAPDYILFTDADIAHAPKNLRHLVARAETEKRVLVSLMAKLWCKSRAEKLLIPAFVFFFDMLFPFAWVNDPARSTAAAAGGCLLAKRTTLEVAGGLDAVHNAIIDDCAIAKLLKPQGPIWLGFTERAKSVRPYADMGAIRHMITRSAYAQLNYSVVVLLGTVFGMLLVFGAAPLLTIFGTGLARLEAATAWVLMTLSYVPMLRFYRLSPAWALALPLTAALYTLFTVESAVQFWRGRGGMWKGRAQAVA
jgi:hopene-associated glycosyltransferase HpnB